MVLEDAYKRRAKLFDEVILYEEMVLNRNVLAQKLQGVGFSQSEVKGVERVSWWRGWLEKGERKIGGGARKG
jgi:hypothetical protein